MRQVPLSRAGIPAKTAGNVLEFLVAKFPHISMEDWKSRLDRGQILGPDKTPVKAEEAASRYTHLFYTREVAEEDPIPFEHQIIWENEELLAVDKPHFLPVLPSGRFVKETLLVRLRERLKNPELAPLHRLDKDTAGVILFSKRQATSAAYHQLFREGLVAKEYRAVAPTAEFSEREISSRIVRDPEFFFRSANEPGPENARTLVECLDPGPEWSLYRLTPHTGKKHQLRLHMATLGIPIKNDPLYPEINDPEPNDFSSPLQLLAKKISFRDPVGGEELEIESRLVLEEISLEHPE